MESRPWRDRAEAFSIFSGTNLAFGTVSVQCLGVVASSSHMPIIVKTPSGTWKALVRKTGFPTTIKTFRLKRDAEDWARRLEDDMVRGMFVQRAPAERMTFEKAIERFLARRLASNASLLCDVCAPPRRYGP
jgi:hypothetical protein